MEEGSRAKGTRDAAWVRGWESAMEMASKSACIVAVRGVGDGFDRVYDWIMDERVGGSTLGLRKASRRFVMVKFMLWLLGGAAETLTGTTGTVLVLGWAKPLYCTTDATDWGLLSELRLP